MLGHHVLPWLVSNNGQVSPIPTWDLAPQSLFPDVSISYPISLAAEETTIQSSEEANKCNFLT